MKQFFKKIHYNIVERMSRSWVVENVLIAKFTENGKTHDCIYCTILRNAVLFACIGFIIGYAVAKRLL